MNGFDLLATALREHNLRASAVLVDERMVRHSKVVVEELATVRDRDVRRVLRSAVTAWEHDRRDIIEDAFGAWEFLFDAENGPENGSPITGDASASLEIMTVLLLGSTWRNAMIRNRDLPALQALGRAEGGVFLRSLNLPSASNPWRYCYERVSYECWTLEGVYP